MAAFVPPDPAPDDDRPVIVHVAERRMWILLNRPRALNAQNQPLRVGFVEAVERLSEDDDLVAGVVLGVGGRSFSAGADLKEVAATPKSRPKPVQNREAWIHFEAARWSVKPLLAAIDGHCVGGGLELAAYCDIRVATEASTFGMPEPRTIGDTGGPAMHQLMRLMPRGEALLLLLTSQPMPARRAYEIGLIQRLSPDRASMIDAANAIVDQMAECSPAALRRAKRIAGWGADMSSEQNEKMYLFAQELRHDLQGQP